MPLINGICEHCGKPFRLRHRPPKTAPRFCGIDCYLAFKAVAKVFTCNECGKQFSACVTDGRKNPRFCSRACHKMHVTSMVDVTCQQCGKVFRTQSSHNRKYCSRSCSGKQSHLAIERKKKSRQTIADRTCPMCGTKLDRRQRSGGRIFCSKPCWFRWAKEHATYRIKQREEDANYRGPNWVHQRRNARRRDNYTCQRCGITEAEMGVQLSVHHIVPFASFDLENYVAANATENLLCLCGPCHGVVEQTGQLPVK